jgi:hypothetical protein
VRFHEVTTDFYGHHAIEVRNEQAVRHPGHDGVGRPAASRDRAEFRFGDFDERRHLDVGPLDAVAYDVAGLRDHDEPDDLGRECAQPVLGLVTIGRQRQGAVRSMDEPLLLDRDVASSPFGEGRIDARDLA